MVLLPLSMLQVIASCDLSPVSRGFLSSPTTVSRLKILAAKASYIIAVNCLGALGKTQAIIIFLAVWLIVLWNVQEVRVPTWSNLRYPLKHGREHCHMVLPAMQPINTSS